MLLLCRVSVKHSTDLLETHMAYSINGHTMLKNHLTFSGHFSVQNRCSSAVQICISSGSMVQA